MAYHSRGQITLCATEGHAASLKPDYDCTSALKEDHTIPQIDILELIPIFRSTRILKGEYVEVVSEKIHKKMVPNEKKASRSRPARKADESINPGPHPEQLADVSTTHLRPLRSSSAAS